MKRKDTWQRLTEDEILRIATVYKGAPAGLVEVIRDVDQRLYEKNHSRYCVDGVHPNGTIQGDGEGAPFQIFDTHEQTYVPGIYGTRADAETVIRLFAQQ